MNACLSIIDIEKLRSPDLSVRHAEALRFVDACKRDGFFLACNHGLESAYLQKSFDLCRVFFALPTEEKEAISVLKSDRFQGYEPPNSKDSKEGFVFGPERQADDALVKAGVAYHGSNMWPESLPLWKEHFLEMFQRLLDVTRVFNRGLTLAFGETEDALDKISSNPMAAMRLLHYPPQKEQPGIAAHTDWGAFSLVFQENVDGLELFTKNEEWQSVSPPQGTCVVNVGNLVSRWTNDILKPTLHRVINRTDNHRYSMAFFLDMNHDAVIQPFSSCVSAERPSRYAPITVTDYIDDMHNIDYGHVK